MSWYIQVMFGAGFPVALQKRVALLPSVTGLGHCLTDIAGSSVQV